MIYKKRFYSSSVKITFGLHQFGEIHIAKWNSPYQPFKKIIFLFNECEISTPRRHWLSYFLTVGLYSQSRRSTQYWCLGLKWLLIAQRCT